MCREYNVPVTQFELDHPALLHSKLGAYVARDEYGVEDEEILSAISWHTTGRPQMTRLEQIIYLADYIEPNRDDELPDLTEIRKLAFTDLDRCCEAVMAACIEFIQRSGKSMDSMTVEAYNYYRKLNHPEEA